MAMRQASKRQDMIYHYTIGCAFLKILKSGQIRIEKSRAELCKEYRANGEIKNAELLEKAKDWGCVLWLSKATDWERTANKATDGVGLKANEKYVPCRLAVTDTVVVDKWTTFRHKYYDEAKALLRGNNAFGSNPYDWYYSESPISVDADHVQSVGVYVDGSWHDFPFSELDKARVLVEERLSDFYRND